jgi:signal peptidase I
MNFNFKPLLFSKTSLSVLLRLSIFMIGILALSYNTFRIFRTDGTSMSETYHHGETLLVNTRAYNKADPQRFDVILVIDIDRFLIGDDFMVKRILGLPGETIIIEQGLLYVNNEEVKGDQWSKTIIGYTDSNSAELTPDAYYECQLGPTEYFVIGDNRIDTWYGPVDISEIIGKVIN